MDSSSGNQNGKFVITSRVFDRTKVASPHVVPMLPENFFPVIGQIIVVWGTIEEHFNALLQALRNKSVAELENSHSSFKKRAKEFKKLSSQCFCDFPAVLAVFTSLAEDAARLVHDRNLIAHGELSCSNQNGGQLIAKGKINGTITERAYGIRELDQVFYDLSHLGGKLFSIRIATATGGFYTPFPKHEKAALLDFLQSNLPNPPTPHRQP